MLLLLLWFELGLLRFGGWLLLPAAARREARKRERESESEGEEKRAQALVPWLSLSLSPGFFLSPAPASRAPPLPSSGPKLRVAQ